MSVTRTDYFRLVFFFSMKIFTPPPPRDCQKMVLHIPVVGRVLMGYIFGVYTAERGVLHGYLLPWERGYDADKSTSPEPSPLVRLHRIGEAAQVLFALQDILPIARTLNELFRPYTERFGGNKKHQQWMTGCTGDGGDNSRQTRPPRDVSLTYRWG